jgi:hypothetical protein
MYRLPATFGRAQITLSLRDGKESYGFRVVLKPAEPSGTKAPCGLELLRMQEFTPIPRPKMVVIPVFRSNLELKYYFAAIVASKNSTVAPRDSKI